MNKKTLYLAVVIPAVFLTFRPAFSGSLSFAYSFGDYSEWGFISLQTTIQDILTGFSGYTRGSNSAYITPKPAYPDRYVVYSPNYVTYSRCPENQHTRWRNQHHRRWLADKEKQSHRHFKRRHGHHHHRHHAYHHLKKNHRWRYEQGDEDRTHRHHRHQAYHHHGKGHGRRYEREDEDRSHYRHGKRRPSFHTVRRY